MKQPFMTPYERKLRNDIRDAEAQIGRLQQAKMRRAQGMGFTSQSLSPTPQGGMGTPQMNPQYVGQRRPWWLSPGNISQSNKVIWDYFFVSVPTLLAPNKTASVSITVNQVASFVWTEVSKVVHLQTPQGFQFLDPEAPGDMGFAPGLTVALSNVSSGQLYMNAPLSLDQIGGSESPYRLPTPIMLPPQSAIGINLSNSNANNSYEVSLAFLGYRLDLPGAQNSAMVTTG